MLWKFSSIPTGSTVNIVFLLIFFRGASREFKTCEPLSDYRLLQRRKLDRIPTDQSGAFISAFCFFAFRFFQFLEQFFFGSNLSLFLRFFPLKVSPPSSIDFSTITKAPLHTSPPGQIQTWFEIRDSVCSLDYTNQFIFKLNTLQFHNLPQHFPEVFLLLRKTHHMYLNKCTSSLQIDGKLYTVNAGNFTCSSQVKRSLAQFTCVTCSLPVNTGKFICFEAASTSRRTHANCLRAHVNLPEYHRHFTGSFTCGPHANLPATSMQNCLLLQAKIHATHRQKHWNRRKKYPHNRRQKKPAILRRITCNCRQSAIRPRVNSPANCR